MVEMSARYLGEKHCQLQHAPSGSTIETDAPRDNQGRGENFSPTDLMGAALASCVLTTMAIVAAREGIAFDGGTAKVVKEMQPSPRRVKRLPVVVHMPRGLGPDARRTLEQAALNCPVKLSLHPDIEAPIDFIYND